jgi:delta-1-pyrroline-5-carboxylate synthetase
MQYQLLTNTHKSLLIQLWHLCLPCMFTSTARNGSRILQSLGPEERATCIYTLADLLLSKEKEILEANDTDLSEATKIGLNKPLLSRLSLTSAKLKNLATGKVTHKPE